MGRRMMEGGGSLGLRGPNLGTSRQFRMELLMVFWLSGRLIHGPKQELELGVFRYGVCRLEGLPSWLKRAPGSIVFWELKLAATRIHEDGVKTIIIRVPILWFRLCIRLPSQSFPIFGNITLGKFLGEPHSTQNYFLSQRQNFENFFRFLIWSL